LLPVRIAPITISPVLTFQNLFGGARVGGGGATNLLDDLTSLVTLPTLFLHRVRFEAGIKIFRHTNRNETISEIRSAASIARSLFLLKIAIGLPSSYCSIHFRVPFSLFMCYYNISRYN
jgi:hypothetical protein